jgi:hypothetical protein
MMRRPLDVDVPVRPELVVEVKYFGRYQAGWIRDGVLQTGPHAYGTLP